MGARFHVHLHRRDRVSYVELSGVLDEDSGLAALASHVGPGPVVIQLSGIERINSCGVREWLSWLGRVERAGGRPVLVECAPAVVAAVNRIHNFVGGARVKSFYAPCACRRCRRPGMVLVEGGEAAAMRHRRNPASRCEACDGPLELDGIDESYFAFLDRPASHPGAGSQAAEPATEECAGGGLPGPRPPAAHAMVLRVAERARPREAGGRAPGPTVRSDGEATGPGSRHHLASAVTPVSPSTAIERAATDGVAGARRMPPARRASGADPAPGSLILVAGLAIGAAFVFAAWLAL